MLWVYLLRNWLGDCGLTASHQSSVCLSTSLNLSQVYIWFWLWSLQFCMHCSIWSCVGSWLLKLPLLWVRMHICKGLISWVKSLGMLWAEICFYSLESWCLQLTSPRGLTSASHCTLCSAIRGFPRIVLQLQLGTMISRSLHLDCFDTFLQRIIILTLNLDNRLYCLYAVTKLKHLPSQVWIVSLVHVLERTLM